MVFPTANLRTRFSLKHYIGALLLFCMVPLAAAESVAAQTYVYGESAQPSQVGKGYVVFRRRGQKVIGAFHYPQSEFSCFVGKMAGQNLEVTTLESVQEASVSVDVPLSQLHAIDTAGKSEQNSLKVCQQEVAVLEGRQQFVVQTPKL